MREIKLTKKMLKDICRECNHERGKHSDVGFCEDCYEENKDYNHHKFIIKNAK